MALGPAAGLAGLLVAVSLTAPARADELPKDPNQIKSLTPEQARKLMEQFEPVEVRASIPNDGYLFAGGGLPLNGLESLDAATAAILVRDHDSLTLQFNALSSLDADTARVLADCDGMLFLDGLTTLPVDAARALAKYGGHAITLGGLTAIDTNAAQALARCKANSLYLHGLKTLAADAARGLTWFRGQTLALDGLATLDAPAARELAAYRGDSLSLTGLTSLDPEAARGLADLRGRELALGGLTELDAATAKALAAFAGGADLSDGEPARPKAAGHEPDGVSLLDLPSITALEGPDAVAVAKALTASRCMLSLPHLQRISPQALAALREKEDVYLPLVDE